jgi:ferritin
MKNKKVEKCLNEQISKEAYSSQLYLSMAVWAESQGLSGVADFMYGHADEERMHMLKIVRYVAERGGSVEVPSIIQPPGDFQTIRAVFETLLEHEIMVTESVNEIVYVTLNEKDYTTHNFMQWFVSEQMEEEALARTILDKLTLIGDEPGGGLYEFDKDIVKISGSSEIQAK